MANRIDKNVKKGSIGGLITIASSSAASYIVYKFGMESDNIPLITGALTAVLLGAADWLKHRKK